MKQLLENEYLLKKLVGKKISGVELIYDSKKYDDVAIMLYLEDGLKLVFFGCNDYGKSALCVEKG